MFVAEDREPTWLPGALQSLIVVLFQDEKVGDAVDVVKSVEINDEHMFFSFVSRHYFTLIRCDVASRVSGFNSCNRTLITRGGCLSEKLIDAPITVAH